MVCICMQFSYILLFFLIFLVYIVVHKIPYYTIWSCTNCKKSRHSYWGLPHTLSPSTLIFVSFLQVAINNLQNDVLLMMWDYIQSHKTSWPILLFDKNCSLVTSLPATLIDDPVRVMERKSKGSLTDIPSLFLFSVSQTSLPNLSTRKPQLLSPSPFPLSLSSRTSESHLVDICVQNFRNKYKIIHCFSSSKYMKRKTKISISVIYLQNYHDIYGRTVGAENLEKRKHIIYLYKFILLLTSILVVLPDF